MYLLKNVALSVALMLITGSLSAHEVKESNVTVFRTSMLAPIFRHDVSINSGEAMKLGVRSKVEAKVQPGKVRITVENKTIEVEVTEGQNVCVDAGTSLGIFGPNVNPLVASCEDLVAKLQSTQGEFK